MTPLIDVIFILVMFFLLSSTFGAWRPLDVLLGRGPDEPVKEASTDEIPPNPVVPAVLIQLKGATNGTGSRILLNGVQIGLEDLAAELDNLVAKGAAEAVLLPEPGTAFQHVVHVLDSARSSAIGKVHLQLD